jgi:hypothetical protein
MSFSKNGNGGTFLDVLKTIYLYIIVNEVYISGPNISLLLVRTSQYTNQEPAPSTKLIFTSSYTL